MTGRQRLTKFEFATLFYEQNGRCGCGCGQKMEAGKVDEEHTIPNAIKPGKPDSLWRRDCHRKKKTPKDRKTIAKVDRLSGKTGQVKRRKARGGSMIKSRGFQKQLKKKMDGTVVKRDQAPTYGERE